MSLNALRLVAHIIKPIKGFDGSSVDEGELLLEAAYIAGKNRVFLAFYEGLRRSCSNIPSSLCEVAEREFKRKVLYEEALAEVAGEAERRGIEFMVVKSIKPFTYVGDDLDILTPSRRDFELLAGMLEDKGYRFIGAGPPEATFVKRIEGVNIYIDVHRQFSASHIPLVDTGRVWKSRVEVTLPDCVVYKPSTEYDVLTVAGHSLLKEFRMSLADFFHAILLLPNIDWNELTENARREKMSYALKIFMHTLYRIHKALYSESPAFPMADDDILLGAAYKVIEKSLKANVSMPYDFPPYLPLMAYLDKLKTGVADGGRESLSLLLNFLRMPFTSREGVNIFWKYVTKHNCR